MRPRLTESQATKMKVSPEPGSVKAYSPVACRGVSWKTGPHRAGSHRDHTLPVASPEGVALFAVILPAGTNPLHQLEEASSKRSPAGLLTRAYIDQVAREVPIYQQSSSHFYMTSIT